MLLKYLIICAFICLEINSLFAENEFKSVAKEKNVCGHLGLCGTEDEPGVLRCHCDNLCPFYGDCCLEFKSNASEIDRNDAGLLEHASVSEQLGCESVRGNYHRFWVVNRINSDQFRHHELCRSTSSEDPVFSSIPVYDPISRLHFRNIYCARFRSSLRFWKVKVTGCVEKIKEYSQNATEGIKGLYDVYERLFYESSCHVKFLPPEDSNPRICFLSDSQCVGTDLHNSCFCFQNPVTRVATNDLHTTTTKYKTYRNYVCQECEPESNADDTILCRLKNDTIHEESVILNDIDPNVLLFTFVKPPFCDSGGTTEKHSEACKVMNCAIGLVQNYLNCTNPVNSVKGIALDLSIRLVNQSNYVGILPLGIIRGVLNSKLQQILREFTLKILSTSLRGVFGDKGMSCVIYNINIHLLLNDFIAFDRSVNIMTEVDRLLQTQKAAIESAGNWRPITFYARGNGSDSECIPVVSQIGCPQTWIILLLSFAVSAGFLTTSLLFEYLGHSLGSFAKFEFVVFKAVYLVTDLVNIGAVLMACNNMTVFLRNTEVGLHWLYLVERIWLSVIGYRIWRTMIARASPVKVSSKPVSKRFCCFCLILVTGVIVVVSNLAAFLQLDTIAVTYDNGGTLFRSNSDFTGIKLLLFIPQYFGIAASAIFCMSILLASRHEKKILNADHWLIQNVRLLILLTIILLQDVIYATQPYFAANTAWQLFRAVSFTFTGIVIVIVELCLLVKFRGA